MEVTVDKALGLGIAAHKEGNLRDAERLYRAILHTQPNHPDANHNLGVLAVSMGRSLEALPLLKKALDANPDIEQFWLSYVDVLLRLERFDAARNVLIEGEKSGVHIEKLEFLRRQIASASTIDKSNRKQEVAVVRKKSKGLAEKAKKKRKKARGASPVASPSQSQVNVLLGHYGAGRLHQAEALATSFTEKFPQDPFGWKALGAVLQQTGKFENALKTTRTALRLSPLDAQLHNNLGNTFREMGRISEAEASYRQATALTPGFADAHNNLGAVLSEQGKFDEAEASLRRAIALNPDDAKGHINLGNALREVGRLRESEASLKHAIILEPDDATGYSNLGNTLRELGRSDQVETSYRRAITLNPDFAEAHNNLGTALKELGRLDEAEAAYENAITLKPDFAEAHRNLATTRRYLRPDEQFRQMEALYHDANISDDHRAQICFALAKASDDIGALNDAFQFYAEGNGLRKKQLGYEKAQDKKLFEQLRASYPRAGAYSLEPARAPSRHTPIFIVGMPRSGTTLVEQIFSSHSMVTGAGELRFAAQFAGPIVIGNAPVNERVLETFRGQYLEALDQRSEGNAVITDKMPQNFRFLGLITAAFPEAKIIHIKRAPAAVCWANYTHYFLGDSLGYSYCLHDILHYHELYRDLMRYWHKVIPERIYDIDYEALTECQEDETRRLIDYAGLPWDDACLAPQDNVRQVGTASNMQVRQKVYQGSSEKWKRYRPYLHGLLDHLD